MSIEDNVLSNSSSTPLFNAFKAFGRFIVKIAILSSSSYFINFVSNDLIDDIRICSENAVFGQPEVGLGITPGFGGTQRLARLVGEGMAKQMIYTARNIKADEALRIGLVNAVYKQSELMDAAKKMAKTIAMNAPIAVRNCKKAINDGMQVDMDKAIVIEEKLFGDCFETEDQRAGMGNFLEKDKSKKLKVVPFQNK